MQPDDALAYYEWKSFVVMAWQLAEYSVLHRDKMNRRRSIDVLPVRQWLQCYSVWVAHCQLVC